MDTEKKERILDAATRLFARYGFRKTSIDEVAAEAGVGKGTVYLTCESKEDLFFQVVHREVRAWVAHVARDIDPRVPADQLLVQCAYRAYAWVAERPLVRDLLVGSHEEVLPLWTDRLEDLRAIGRANTVEILRIGVRQGLFRQDLDVEKVARILQDLHATGVLLAVRANRSVQEQMATTAAAFDLLLKGLLAR
ncbi:MAG: TetR/AcrR family transcriptional regulator [Myxococcota bacterium]